MNDLLYRLASAIASAEGFFVAGSLPQRDNNPGDLRAAPWLKNSILQSGFWQANTKQEGIAGLYHQLALDIARGYSLRQLIYAWAPPTDGNKTQNYLQETARRTGITDTESPLWNLLNIDLIS